MQAPTTQNRVHVDLSRQFLPVLPFRRDARSACPRIGWTGQVPDLIPSGVPDKLKATFNRNLIVTSFPYARWTSTDGRLRDQSFTLVSMEHRRWRIILCPASAAGS
jgi:hypothetical protein